MPLNPYPFALPRPGAAIEPPKPPIVGPSEAFFTEAFGPLLPPARFLETGHGKAAYYELPPSHQNLELTSSPRRVLLIHGVQTPALGMLPLARALQASFPSAHFVLFDHWGHGLSDTPVLPHEPSLFHTLIDTLLDKLEWTCAHLVGFSFGGALTMGYVASRPSRVQSYTLVAPVGLIPPSVFSDVENSHLRGDTTEAEAREWVLGWLEGGELVVPQDWRERVGRGEVVRPAVLKWQIQEHPGHMASVLAIIRDGGVSGSDTKFIEAVRTGLPSLAVLGGTDDVCTEKQLNEVGMLNVAVIPQVGHEVVRERASEVAAFISNFWTDLDKVSSG
ncbi:Alpha/Beta hydrolase protein [Lophiotrema nucula]|uniref:Alpha/Beta hydrolase protein n=1 Tax=Lophiotrema nucula TaxID=690887 RepID=A0A6A5YLG5_9PLEO|nr:Alpha/Beta hydrolase protein [Lophiotrema nucula]